MMGDNNDQPNSLVGGCIEEEKGFLTGGIFMYQCWGGVIAVAMG